MSKDSLFRSDPDESTLPNSIRAVMTEHALKNGVEESGDWQQRALNGFIDSAQHAWNNKLETTGTVATGLAVGAIIQTGLNNAELVGGKVGAVAKLGKAAAIAIPLVLSGTEIARADDPAHEAGKMAFEMGLFLGTAKVGTFADRIPGIGKVLGPRPMTPMQEKVEFQVFGKNVKISAGSRDVDYPLQVRLSSGKGFLVDESGSHTAKLVDMPLEVPGKGRLIYEPRSTTLVNESGSYTRSLRSTVMHTTQDGQSISTYDGKKFDVLRQGGPLGNETLTFQPDGWRTVTQGNYQSGRAWSFSPDGAISMKSLPSGKYRMTIEPSGDGTYTYTHGTSRGIAGRVGPRSNHSPLVRDKTPISINPSADGARQPLPFPIPDVTLPDPKITRNLSDAKEVLDGLVGRH